MGETESSGQPETPRAEAKREFRRSIMSAALSEFSSHGFHRAQIGDIARRAEVSVGTIYNLFKSKENLFFHLINEHSAEIFGALSESISGNRRAIARLLDFVRAKGQIYEDHKEMVKLFFREGRGGRIDVRSLMPNDPKNMYDALLGDLAEVCREGIDEGSIKADVDPFDLAVAIDSLTNSYIVLHMDYPDRHPYSNKGRSVQKIIFEGALSAEGKRELDAIAP